MTASNQDFTLYRGDDAKPLFTIYDAAGVAIDISTVSEIQWLLHDDAGVVKLTKLKTTGGVTFVTSGVNGQIYVVLNAADSNGSPGLDGWYWHSARITDSAGKLSVVEVGRLLVLVRERGE